MLFVCEKETINDSVYESVLGGTVCGNEPVMGNKADKWLLAVNDSRKLIQKKTQMEK